MGLLCCVAAIAATAGGRRKLGTLTPARTCTGSGDVRDMQTGLP